LHTPETIANVANAYRGNAAACAGVSDPTAGAHDEGLAIASKVEKEQQSHQAATAAHGPAPKTGSEWGGKPCCLAKTEVESSHDVSKVRKGASSRLPKGMHVEARLASVERVSMSRRRFKLWVLLTPRRSKMSVLYVGENGKGQGRTLVGYLVRRWFPDRDGTASAGALGILTLLLPVEAPICHSEVPSDGIEGRIVSSFATTVVVRLKLVARRAVLDE